MSQYLIHLITPCLAEPFGFACGFLINREQALMLSENRISNLWVAFTAELISLIFEIKIWSGAWPGALGLSYLIDPGASHTRPRGLS